VSTRSGSGGCVAKKPPPPRSGWSPSSRSSVRLRHELGPDAIRLALLVAAVRREDQRVRRRPDAADDPTQHRAHDARGRGAEPREHAQRRRPRHALHRVPRRHVRDLVPEHAGELVLRAHEHEQPARNVDPAPGQRERVGLRRVDDLERVRDVGPRRDGGEPRPHRRDVRRELRVVDEAHRPRHLLRLLAAELLLLRGRDQRDLRAPRDGIHRAAERDDGEEDRGTAHDAR
jgi:hypothetical protein